MSTKLHPASCTSRRIALQGVAAWAAALAMGLLATGAHAQDAWPTKTVKIVSPFPAGGTSDVMGRMLAEELGVTLEKEPR
jgi:tripartite-type tricarboxylate transporter receptor subunit TctC